MRTALPLSSALFFASLGALFVPTSIGCATNQEEVGSSEHAATSAATDLAAARDVVALLGGDNGHCSQCHGVTAAKIRSWGDAMTDVQASCLADGKGDPNAPAVNLTTKQRIDCLRSSPNDASSPFAASRLGLFAAAAAGDDFKALFTKGFATSTTEYADFTHKVAMPRSGTPLTADEFEKIKAWVLRGMPQLDAAFGAAPAAACTPSTTPELAAHLAAMKSSGWGARLADQATPMFGCGGSSAALSCLGNLPDATATFGASDVTQKLRQLHKQPLASHYWVRSSADGRYVGYGMDDSAKIVDLTQPETASGINVEADYDPYFLPSNDGFAFAGAHTGGSIVLCRQSLLGDVASAAAPAISLSESKCSTVGDNVYMSIGTALDNSRYFMTFGSHENDDGGNEQTTPLPAAFSASARTIFTPMVNDGLAYRPQPQVTVTLAHEGDMMLSPSSLLAATRFGDGNKPRGYRVRFIKPQQSAAGALTINTPLAAEICMPGQKPNFSFDERFVATHQYVDRSDPAMAGLASSSSNIMVADLATGKQVRITTSRSGVFALYPHFRADGWLYFAVRDMNQNVEYIVASDIALRLSQ